MKICPVRAELFHADGRLDMPKLIVAFRNFANARNQGINTVKPGYKGIGLCNISFIASHILWYQIITGC
jgi:hypothetical protein